MRTNRVKFPPESAVTVPMAVLTSVGWSVLEAGIFGTKMKQVTVSPSV